MGVAGGALPERALPALASALRRHTAFRGEVEARPLAECADPPALALVLAGADPIPRREARALRDFIARGGVAVVEPSPGGAQPAAGALLDAAVAFADSKDGRVRPVDVPAAGGASAIVTGVYVPRGRGSRLAAVVAPEGVFAGAALAEGSARSPAWTKAAAVFALAAGR